MLNNISPLHTSPASGARSVLAYDTALVPRRLLRWRCLSPRFNLARPRPLSICPGANLSSACMSLLSPLLPKAVFAD
eukprot:849300-Pleurochrysis_carterae.AAC.4